MFGDLLELFRLDWKFPIPVTRFPLRYSAMLVKKIITQGDVIIGTLCMYTCVYVCMYYNLLSPFNIAFMYRCLGMTTCDWDLSWGEKIALPVKINCLALYLGVRPCCHVSWWCHYAGLVYTTIVLRFHGCSFIVMFRRQYLSARVLVLWLV